MGYDLEQINSNTTNDWLVLYADDCLWPMKSRSKITVHGILYFFYCRGRLKLGFGLLGVSFNVSLSKQGLFLGLY